MGTGGYRLSAVRAGLGLAQLTLWMVEDDIRTGKLSTVLDGLSGGELPVNLLWPRMPTLVPGFVSSSTSCYEFSRVSQTRSKLIDLGRRPPTKMAGSAVDVEWGMPATGLLRGVAIDIAVWFCLPLAFLILYAGVLGRPESAVLPHVLAMALPFLLQAFLRLVLSRGIPHAGLRRAISSLVIALLIGGMITYYVLVVISVHFWGSVVAWSAIPTFFRQAPDVVEAVGVPWLAAVAVAITLMGSILAGCWFYLKRFDWTPGLGRSAWVKAVCAAAGCCVLWIQVASATEAPWIAQEEPLSMSLFPLADTRDIEGHRVTVEEASARDALEDRARAKYEPAAAGSSKPNVILIVVDAMRPANMSLFGYARETTPYLDSLARTVPVRKFITHAPCSDTACGLISLTTSRPPRDFSFRPFGLHEALRRNGYRTHVIQSGTYLHPVREYYGELDTWFDGTSVKTMSISDDQMIVDKLGSMPDWDGVPALFHFRLMSAHVTRKDSGKGPFLPAESYLLPPSNKDGADFIVPAATNFYDNGVREADRFVETIVNLLRRKGYLNRALIVVTADHGEALGEHGMYAHANSVREEVLRVPVMFIAQGYEPERLQAASAFPLQIDVAPTILAELGLPRPGTWKGRPLQEPHEPTVSYFEERDFSGLIDTRQPGKIWKYWLDRTWGDEFVFELSEDPRESRNVVSSVPEELLRDWRRHVLYTKPAH